MMGAIEKREKEDMDVPVVMICMIGGNPGGDDEEMGDDEAGREDRDVPQKQEEGLVPNQVGHL